MNLKTLQRNKDEREEAPQDRINRLIFEAKRGRRTKQLLSSSWWVEHMDQYLTERAGPNPEDGLPGGGFWVPGCGLGVEEVALASASYGGRLKEIRTLRATISSWVKAGEEAEIELKKRDIEI